MKYADLREFISALESRGELKRIQVEVDPYLEMTEIADRTLRQGGPALLFENPKGYNTPVLANLFGTEQRVALGMGEEDITALREIGELLAYLRQPDPPKGMKDLVDKAPLLRKVLDMGPKRVYPAINIRASGTRREELLTGDEELQRMWILRKLLHGMEDLPAIEFLLDKLKDTKTNDEFFKSMKRK